MGKLPIIRFVLTWLEIGKVYTIPTSPSLEPITAKFKGSDETLANWDIRGAISGLGIEVSEVKEMFKGLCDNFSYHETSAAGPNGHAL